MSEKKIALIPSYKPDNNLIKLVENFKKEKIDILIVDDGSGPKYKEILDKCKDYSKIISYEENKGKGHALKTGFKYIKENYKEPYIIVTVDCDGQHRVEDAKKLLEEVSKNREILVIGKRLRNNTTPFRSKIGNAITSFVYKLVAGLYIYDTQSGLRSFSDTLIEYLLLIGGTGFEYEMNVLLNCAKDKVKMKEIEISTVYINKNESSNFKAVKDSYKIYKEILKFKLSTKKN